MDVNTTCSSTLGAELKASGLEFCSIWAYDFTKGSIMFSWLIPEDFKANYFPLLSIKELLECFWVNNYAVCVNLHDGVAWVNDSDNYLQYVHQSINGDFNEADYMVKLLIMAIKRNLIPVSSVNEFLWKRLNNLKTEHT